jgi:hypothetical protein
VCDERILLTIVIGYHLACTRSTLHMHTVYLIRAKVNIFKSTIRYCWFHIRENSHEENILFVDSSPRSVI